MKSNRTIGDIVIYYRKKPTTFRELAAKASVAVFEQTLKAWSLRTNRQDILKQWEDWKQKYIARKTLYSYAAWIHEHFDSIDTFLTAWNTYPSAVQRLFPLSVLSQIEKTLQNAHKNMPVDNSVALAFCDLPFHPLIK